MAKKNKGKNNKPVKQQPKTLTQQNKVEAQALMDETQPLLESISQDGIDVESIANEIVVDSSMPEQGMDSFISEIKRFRKILEAVKRTYDKLNDDLEKQKIESDQILELNKAEKEKVDREIEDRRAQAEKEIAGSLAEISEKRKKLNDREIELTRREMEATGGDNSSLVEYLLTVFRQSQSQAISNAKEFLDEMSSVTGEYLKRLEELSLKEAEIETREKELKSRLNKLSAREADFDDRQDELREDLTSEIKSEYESELEDKKQEIERQRRLVNLEQQSRERAESELAVIKSAFGDVDPMVMAEECNRLKAEIDRLLAELNERPTTEDLENKTRKVLAIEHELTELRKKFDDMEYYEYMARFTNSDLDVMEKKNLQSQNESLKAQVESLREINEELVATIKEINENRNKENAFKTSSKYDSGEYQIGMISPSNPKDLVELVDYLQSILAHGNYGGKKLYYSKDTIKKFIAGLHMSRISILQGISGTGKTSLPKAIAEALITADKRYAEGKGVDELQNAPYRICPVQSGWRDKMDLLGFYNSFEKSYHETEFFNALYLANQPKYRDTLFFIVLDEMNLSRPEHYFADFLSKLELGEDQQKIKIDNVPEDICPILIQGATIVIPPNVRFIGTANHDETTLEFAPKTYDRSNVIDMPRNYPNDKIENTPKRYCVSYSWFVVQFTSAMDSYKGHISLFEYFIKNQKLIDLLADKGIGIGNRFEDQARRFISVFLACGTDNDEDLAKAADHLITTRLFRTIKDNYDIDTKQQLIDFYDKYGKLFFETFEYEPLEAKELIEDEKKKKKS